MTRSRRNIAAAVGTIILAAGAVAALTASVGHDNRQAGDSGSSAARQNAENKLKTSNPSADPVLKVAPPVSLPSTGFRYLGVYEGSDPSVAQYGRVQQFATTVGRQPNIVMYYSAWNQPFSAPLARTARQHGATLLLDIDPTSTSCAAIAAGQQDGFLWLYAQSVKAFGHPVIISFGHEMNGTWYSWGWTHTQPAVFVQAWRHIVDVFRQTGADNVTWLWTINSVNSSEGPITDYWPGASYVTWVGLDAYYFFSDDNFSSVFGPTLAAIRQITSKPVLISETAIGQVAGQAANIPGLFAGVSKSGILGFVWFDEAQNYGIYHQDWRLEGHPDAVAAFRAAVATYLSSDQR